MKSLHEGQLVTVTHEGATLDGIVFHAESFLKAIVAVADEEGAVLQTFHRNSLQERTEPSEHDELLRRLIKRSAEHGGAGSGKVSGGARGHTRGPAHRPTGR
jgi:hypothetical protein